MWKKRERIKSLVLSRLFFFLCCLIKWNWWINFFICFPLNLSKNWQKNTWLTLRLDLKKHGKWTWLLSGHPDRTSLVNNAFYTFNLIQGILSASFACFAIYSIPGFPRSELLTLWYLSVQRAFSGFVNIYRSFIENYN